eukprot:13378434-Heterocapsa_arctica.AAC.1
MLSHLRRLTNVRKYAEVTNNMEVTAVRTIDRLLGLVSREESEQVPEESPPMTSPEEGCASRP